MELRTESVDSKLSRTSSLVGSSDRQLEIVVERLQLYPFWTSCRRTGIEGTSKNISPSFYIKLELFTCVYQCLQKVN
jgi:hypothetical protein